MHRMCMRPTALRNSLLASKGTFPRMPGHPIFSLFDATYSSRPFTSGNAGYQYTSRNSRGGNHSSQNHNRQKGRTVKQSVNRIASDLAQLATRMENLGYQMNPPPIWTFETHQRTDPTEEQEQLFQCIQGAANSLADLANQGVLRPDRKHSHLVTNIVERFLLLCNVFSFQNHSVIELAQNLQKLMKEFRLELSHKQCDYVVQLSARHGDWEKAADIYLNQIDLDRGGYVPVTGITPATITGLYCIARSAILQNAQPVESTIDGVLKLGSVSPMDLENYTLATGVALGYAGCWEDLTIFLKSSYKANSLGQPLAAAAMQACIICQKYDEALVIYDELVSGKLAAASQWQWGIHQHIHPACQDLAIRAIGGIQLRSEQDLEQMQERIAALYQNIAENGRPMSVEALCAVVRVLGQTATWQEVTNIFLPLLEKPLSDWLVLGESCQITSADTTKKLSDHDLVPALGSLLEEFMQILNSHRQYGLALLIFRLFEISIASTITLPYEQLLVNNNKIDGSPILQSLLPTICVVKNTKELLATTMVSLCGVKVEDEATRLFDATAYLFQFDNESNIRRQNNDIYSYAKSLQPDQTRSRGWQDVHRHICRLTACIATLERCGTILEEREARILSAALGMTLHACADISSPETGIALGQWIERRTIPRKTPNKPSLFNSKQESIRFSMKITDSLLSSSIEAFVGSGHSDNGNILINQYLEGDRYPSQWPLTYHQALKALFTSGDRENGMEFFRTIIADVRNPGIFYTAARSLKVSGNWQAVIDLYRLALSAGCSSEQLSLLAMEAIVATDRLGQNPRHLPYLRSVISETAKAAGISAADWTVSNYWRLKNLLGFSKTRVIMGWHDYSTSRLDELQLAFETLEKMSSEGRAPANEALLTVVKAAGNFEQHEVPFNRSGLPSVPREKDDWIGVLHAAIEEAKATDLVLQPSFVFESAIALEHLGCYEACVETVVTAVSKGLILPKSTLQCAIHAAEVADIQHKSSDLKMLLEGPTESDWR